MGGRGVGGGQLHSAWVRSVFLSKTLGKPFGKRKRHKDELGLKCTRGLGGILKGNSSGSPLWLPSFQAPKQCPLSNFTALVSVTEELIASGPARSDDLAQLLSPDIRQEATRAFRTMDQGRNNGPFIYIFRNKKFNLRRCFLTFAPPSVLQDMSECEFCRIYSVTQHHPVHIISTGHLTFTGAL